MDPTDLVEGIIMAGTSRAKTIGVWVLSVLLALEFLFSGTSKLRGVEEMVKTFARFGYSITFLRFIGACEVAGAIGLLIPKLRFWAAAGLAIIMLGAVGNHLTHSDPPQMMAPAIVTLLLVLLEGWLGRPTRSGKPLAA